MKDKIIKDFYENDYFSYESDCDLWNDEKISLLIDFGEEANKSEMLMKYIDKINEILKWIDEHKKNVTDFLIEKQCLELAEEWVTTCEEVDENTYKSQIIVPILANSDIVGGIVALSFENEATNFTMDNVKTLQTIANFMAKQVE